MTRRRARISPFRMVQTEGKARISAHRKENRTMEKRSVIVEQKKGLRDLNNLILVGVLMAVGIVLRLLAGVINVGGFHPNFLLATYCLAILLVRPNFLESVIIGILSGVISQIGTSMAWIGIVSETIGAVVMFLLIFIPMHVGKLNLQPIVCTLLTTLVSGFAFIGMAALVYVNPMSMAQFISMALTTLVTAALNCVIVQILVLPLRGILKKDE